MKLHRQSAILDVINQYDITSQKELIEKLAEFGINVTQATISRDIKELQLIKVPVENGKYKYTKGSNTKIDTSPSFNTLFKTAVININFAQNIIVLKTTSGMAQGVCVELDTMKWDGVLGTIAGDDTIFIVVSSGSRAASLTSEFKKIIM